MLNNLLILFFGYFLMWVMGFLIKKLLGNYIDILKSKEEKNGTKSGIIGAGASIGTLERILVFSLVLVDQYAAISIVFAAKSIARFKELDDRDVAEYYLLGTLASITLAVITGIIFKMIFGNIVNL